MAAVPMNHADNGDAELLALVLVHEVAHLIHDLTREALDLVPGRLVQVEEAVCHLRLFC
jgi:hypothetical protein